MKNYIPVAANAGATTSQLTLQNSTLCTHQITFATTGNSADFTITGLSSKPVGSDTFKPVPDGDKLTMGDSITFIHACSEIELAYTYNGADKTNLVITQLSNGGI